MSDSRAAANQERGTKNQEQPPPAASRSAAPHFNLNCRTAANFNCPASRGCTLKNEDILFKVIVL